LADRHQTNCRSEMWRPLPQKLMAQDIKISARFETNSLLYRGYRQNETRQSSTGIRRRTLPRVRIFNLVNVERLNSKTRCMMDSGGENCSIKRKSDSDKSDDKSEFNHSN